MSYLLDPEDIQDEPGGIPLSDLGPYGRAMIGRVLDWFEAHPLVEADEYAIYSDIGSQAPQSVNVAITQLYHVRPELIRTSVGRYTWDPDRGEAAEALRQLAAMKVERDRLLGVIRRACTSATLVAAALASELEPVEGAES